MYRRFYFASAIILAFGFLLSACGSSATSESSPTPSTSTPVPATPTNTPPPPATPTRQDTGTAPTRVGQVPTQALFPSQQLALEDKLVLIKQKYGEDLALIETGYLSLDGGESYTNLMVKVRCMSGDCTTGTLYQWIIVCIAPFEEVPESLVSFNIRVYGQQDELLEGVTGKWADLKDLNDHKIRMEELLGRLVFIR